MSLSLEIISSIENPLQYKIKVPKYLDNDTETPLMSKKREDWFETIFKGTTYTRQQILSAQSLAKKKINVPKVEKQLITNLPVELSFLDKCRETGSDVNIFSPFHGSFNIDSDNINKIFKYLNDSYKNGKTESFAEKQKEYSGIMLDFDMYHKSNEQQLTNAHIETLVELISKVLGKVIKFNDLETFKIAVIRRPMVNDCESLNSTEKVLKYCSKKKMYKDGLHIIIPEIMISKSMKRCLNTFLLSVINKSGIFDDIIFTNDKYDHILDMASAHVPVFFVGGIKPNKDKRNAYPLSFVWEIDADEEGDVNINRYNLKKMTKYNIPLELSINEWGIETFTKKKIREFSDFGKIEYDRWIEEKNAKEKEKMDNEEKYRPSEIEINKIVNNEDKFITLLDKVVCGLMDERAINTGKWNGVIKILKNLCNVYKLDRNQVVSICDNFSKRGGEKYIGSLGAMGDKFDSMSGKGYMGLLWHWLKDDNIPLFKVCIREFFTICPPSKQEYPNSFDLADPYDYFQFRNEFSGKCFDSYDELINAIKGKYEKVISHILTGEGVFIKKIGGEIDITKRLGTTGFDMFYKNDKGKTITQIFEKFVVEQTKLSFPKMICSLMPDNISGFNIWTGFQSNRVKLDNLSSDVRSGLELMKSHIMEIWACNNIEYYNYIISWFAGIFTNLSSINKKALVMISPQGCGKGTMIEFLGYLLRDSNIYNGVGVSGITQKHNTAIQNKRLVVINEMSSTKDEFRSNFDKLKSFITDPYISIEPKGINPYQIDNISDFILFSNHEDSLPVEQGDRRYAVFLMDGKYANDEKYFTELRKECFNQDVANAFYTYLLDFNAVSLNTPPHTEIRKQLINNSKANPLKFIDEVIEYKIFDDETDIKGKLLYQKYREWCSDNGERTTFSNTKFGTIISKIMNRKRKSDGIYYVLPEL